MAAEAARLLRAKLDIVLSRKIGSPGDPELAIGSVEENGDFLINTGLALRVGADKKYIESERMRQWAEIKNRSAIFRKVKPKVALEGKTVIIIDDGVATGLTMQGALLSARGEKPKKVVAAFPVGAREALDLLSGYADELIVLRVPEFLGAVGQFYRNFGQVTDGEVLSVLKNAVENEAIQRRL